MKLADFKKVQPFFSAKEKWGNIEGLQWYHVHHLYLIRKALSIIPDKNWQMIVHCSCEVGGHSPDGFHPKGLATDCHFKTDASLGEQLETLTEILYELGLIDFVGLGVYLNWNNRGFHIDSRGYLSRWGRDENGEEIGFADVMKLVR